MERRVVNLWTRAPTYLSSGRSRSTPLHCIKYSMSRRIGLEPQISVITLLYRQLHHEIEVLFSVGVCVCGHMQAYQLEFPAIVPSQTQDRTSKFQAGVPWWREETEEHLLQRLLQSPPNKYYQRPNKKM